MAKKIKGQEEKVLDQQEDEVIGQQETIEEVVSEELQIVRNAITDDNFEALETIKTAETTAPSLMVLITTYVALLNALGPETGATIHARENLWNYKPPIEKAKKEPKALAFNEAKALKEALAEENSNAALTKLLADVRISEALSIAIVTYQTLTGVEGLPEEVISAAKATLESFGSKSKSGKIRAQSSHKAEFHVQVDDLIYTTLTAALLAQGYSRDKLIGEKNHREIDIVWRQIRGKLLKEGFAELDGKTYKQVPLSDSAIGTERKKSVTEVPSEAADDVDEVDEVSEQASEEVYE